MRSIAQPVEHVSLDARAPAGHRSTRATSRDDGDDDSSAPLGQDWKYANVFMGFVALPLPRVALRFTRGYIPAPLRGDDCCPFGATAAAASGED
jgi:hypothetical protein